MLAAVGMAWGAMAPEDRVELADGLYARGLYELALEEYSAVAREAPDFPRRDAVLFRAAECLRHLGREENAQRFYEQTAAEYPDSEYRFRADLRRAERASARGRSADAAQWLQDALARNPPKEWAAPLNFHAALALEKDGRTNEAIRAYRHVVENFRDSPVAPMAAMNLAELYRRIGTETNDLRSLYAMVAERASDGRWAAEALFNLAEVAYRQGDYAAAWDALESLRAKYPDDLRVKESAMLRAWTLYRMERTDQAMVVIDDLLREKPEDSAALYLKANLLRAVKRGEEAAPIYTRLRERLGADDPLRMAVWYESAVLAFDRRRYREAAELAAAVTSGAGDLFDRALRLQAEALAAAGETGRAREAWRVVRDRAGENATVARAWFEFGRLSQQLGETSEAMRAYAQVASVAADPDLAAPALHALATLREATGDDEAASKDWKTLVEKFPMYGKVDEVVYRKAANEARRGRTAEAEQTLKDFARRFPESPWRAEAAYLRGALAERAERWKEAEIAYRESMVAARDAEERTRAHWRLAYVIQKQGREDDAATAYDMLLDTGAVTNMPPELLEWLTRRSLESGAVERAVRAARAWARIAATPEQRQAAWCCVGRAERMLGRHEAAVAAYEEGLKEAVETDEAAAAWLALGELRLKMGRIDGAREAFVRAGAAESASARTRAESYFGLGRVAEESHDWDAARRYYLGVALLYDDETLSPESLWRAARAMRRAGQVAEADQILQELVQRYPRSRWAGSEASDGKED